MLKKAIILLALAAASFSVTVQGIVIINGSSVDLDITLPNKPRIRTLSKGDMLVVCRKINQFTVEVSGQTKKTISVSGDTDSSTIFNLVDQVGGGVAYACYSQNGDDNHLDLQ